MAAPAVKFLRRPPSLPPPPCKKPKVVESLDEMKDTPGQQYIEFLDSIAIEILDGHSVIQRPDVCNRLGWLVMVSTAV